MANYAIVVNQPGYLPEDEPHYVGSLHDARNVAAALIQSSLCDDPDASIGRTSSELDQILMAAYDLGPEGGHLWLPGDGGKYVVDVIPELQVRGYN